MKTNSKLFRKTQRYILASLFLFGCTSVYAQNSEHSLIGTWRGIVFSPTIPAANGSTVQCVFSPDGDYTCLASKPRVGTVRHWGRYRNMGAEIDFEIRGHEPDSVTMPSSDHMEILRLTPNALQTRTPALGSYIYTTFRRIR